MKFIDRYLLSLIIRLIIFKINMSKKLYRYGWLLWDHYNYNGISGHCPNCKCVLTKSKDDYSRWEYKYDCIKCDFKITLNKSIDDKWEDVIKVIDAEDFKDAEIINLDGDLVRVQREWIKDEDYRVDVKISRNKRDELQLMVMAGSKKDSNKIQLFLDPTHEKLSFDQNNNQPREIFSKVIAIFKNSNYIISDSLDDLDLE